jgi:hypothetical protein
MCAAPLSRRKKVLLCEGCFSGRKNSLFGEK